MSFGERYSIQRSSTCFLVLQYLSHCDSVILMKEGRVAEMGPYDELMQHRKVIDAVFSEIYV